MRTYMRPLVLGTVLFASSVAPAAPPAQPPVITIEPAALAKTAVCTDGKSHYVALGPNERSLHTLYYGDAANLSIVEPFSGGMLPGNDFLDPRYVAPTYNPSFRGLDMRIYSSVEYDADKKTCALRCGERNVPLTIVPDADAKAMLGKAVFHKSLRTREPYALARDDRGVYYYVDHGLTPETKDSYRIYVGKKGAMKQQKMKDVAADSAGEVFSTASGDLRLVTMHDSKEYSWVQKGKSSKLTMLPPFENQTLIYNTLGVYQGERFGTPCDEM